MTPSETEVAIIGGGAAGIAAGRRLRDAGVDVIHLVVVLDRGEGGEENIRGADIPYSPLFRIADLELD